MPAQAQHTTRWYKNVWPWVILALLSSSVVLSINLIRVAVNNQDTLVVDNYYEAGKGINRSLDRERLAQSLNLKAEILLDELVGEVSLRLSGRSLPDSLTLSLISPTQPEKDQQIHLLASTEPGRYIGQLQEPVSGRRFVELLGEQEGQTWRLFEEENIVSGSKLNLGDEAILGAEDLSQ